MNSRDTKLFEKFLLCIAIILFLCVPLIINALLGYNWSTAKDLENSDWLAFWGSYIGSIIGVFATLIAFMYTYKQNEQQNRDIQEQNKKIQDQNKIIQDQNENARKIAEEQMRLQSLPFINMSPIGTSDANEIIRLDNGGNYTHEEYKEWNVGCYRFTNIGVGPAIGVKLSSFNLGHFSVGESNGIALLIPKTTNYIESVKLTYKDREERNYQQTFNLKFQDGILLFKALTSPFLIK